MCGHLLMIITNNWLSLKGYDRILSFIATQDPLENTVNEFWCMIYELNVSSILMLSHSEDQCQYWPLQELTLKNYEIQLISEEPFDCFILRKLRVTKLSCVIDSPHVVSQYQFLSWKHNEIIPETTFTLISLCDRLLSWHETNSPIVIHCNDGSQRSCICISVLSLLQQIKVDKRVDVFQTCRYTALQRCAMLESIVSHCCSASTFLSFFQILFQPWILSKDYYDLLLCHSLFSFYFS